jgi:hypothetical protein
MTATFEHIRIRVNVTWSGTLLELSESSALVRVPAAPPTDRQTTVVIDGEDGQPLHLPARVVLSIPQTWGPARLKQEHHIVVEFFGVSEENKRRLRKILARANGAAAAHVAA